MRQLQSSIFIETQGKGPVAITDQVSGIVSRSEVSTGLCVLFVQHTSASLIIQENADPTARADLERWLERIAPQGEPYYRHRAEGPDDMPSHIRAAITSVSVTIPVTSGALALGTWQGIYLWEHRSRPHRRTVVVHVIGE